MKSLDHRNERKAVRFKEKALFSFKKEKSFLKLDCNVSEFLMSRNIILGRLKIPKRHF